MRLKPRLIDFAKRLLLIQHVTDEFDVLCDDMNFRFYCQPMEDVRVGVTRAVVGHAAIRIPVSPFPEYREVTWWGGAIRFPGIWVWHPEDAPNDKNCRRDLEANEPRLFVNRRGVGVLFHGEKHLQDLVTGWDWNTQHAQPCFGPLAPFGWPDVVPCGCWKNAELIIGLPSWIEPLINLFVWRGAFGRRFPQLSAKAAELLTQPSVVLAVRSDAETLGENEGASR